ncbi:MAG: NAD(P)H-dependent oxidoreductase [Desulfobacteraceae bacterium]|jgi:multimeric flavodoxin WrbA|nr:NAD(P)H-dependent oxidoreductase [Desulfobacteraceae bacterium]
MLVVGLQGSPRKKGNTNFLLSTFMTAAEKLGARTLVIDVAQKEIIPCKEYTVCEKKGYCPIEDDVKDEIYPLLREAELVVLATPIFFYNMTAQLKAVVDRCQTFWARKYKLKLKDPGAGMRSGFLLAVGATKGKNLFEGLNLTAQYFFDAIWAKFEDSLTYRGIEGPKDMAAHPTVIKDIEEAAKRLLQPFQGRKKVLFACRENACRSQMASAFAQFLAGDKLDVSNGGSEPAEKVNPDMVKVMHEKGIDMGFRKPRAMEGAIANDTPELIITMGCGEQCPRVPGARIIDWDLPDPAGKPIEFMRDVRDEIETKVLDLIKEIE